MSATEAEEGPELTYYGTPIPPRTPRVRMKKSTSRAKIKKQQRKIEMAQKRAMVLEARKAGLSYARIAATPGPDGKPLYTNASAARKAFMKAMDELIQEPAAELKSLQIERLNHMLTALWSKVQAGDEAAMNTALRIMDKMDRLEGTEAQQSQEIHHSGSVLVAQGNKEDFISAMKQIAGIDQNGANITAVQVPQALGGPSDALTGPGGVTYPPGMGQTLSSDSPQPVDDPVDDVVDGEVVEEEDRDVSSTSDVPVKKTYRFGVDPTARKGKQDG